MYFTNRLAADPQTYATPDSEWGDASDYSTDSQYSDVYTHQKAEDPKLHSFMEATQLGLLAAQEGDQTTAIGYFRLARKLDITSSEGAMNLGVCLMRSNLLDEALNEVRKGRNGRQGDLCAAGRSKGGGWKERMGGFS